MICLSSVTGEMFDFNAVLARGGLQDEKGRDWECKERTDHRFKNRKVL